MTLGYVARALVQALTAYALVSSIASLAVAVAWRRVADRLAPPVGMARRIFLLRMAPSTVGAAAAMLVLLAYARWEIRAEAEPVGVVAVVWAAGALALFAAAGWRAAGALRQTWRIGRSLAGASGSRLPAVPIPAYVVESRFPVVALVGLVMARLFVARRVIEVCTAEEFGAVIAHEQAHARERDNLRRLAMTAAPDMLGLLPAGRRLQEAWLHAAELSADAWAATHTDGGVHLASALVKVARLATSPADLLPASALYRGEPIAERVHRLIEPSPAPTAGTWSRWTVVSVGACALAAAVLALPLLHRLAEQILRLGL